MKNRITYIIVILNILVLICWKFATSHSDFMFMSKNFLVSYSALLEGRVWTLLTSVFSHFEIFHLVFNMLALLSFSQAIVFMFGKFHFISFYLIAGIAGSLAHVITSAFLMNEPHMNALGASGAVSGIIMLFSLFNPTAKLLIMGLIPIRAIWGALAFVAFDVWGLITQTKGAGLPIGHGAHLGGAVIGIIYFFYFKNKMKPA